MKNKMEQLLGLGPMGGSRVLPGSQPVEGRDFLYLSGEGNEPFGLFFKRLVRYVAPPLPKGGGAVLEGCEITLPTGEIFHAVSYKGDLDGWRRQIEQGAEALKAKVARIANDSIVVADGTEYPLAGCTIKFD